MKKKRALPAKMGRDSDAGAVVKEVLDGGDGSPDTGVIGDLLAIEGDVKIAADENLWANVRNCFD
jgi:hypothetical protein